LYDCGGKPGSNYPDLEPGQEFRNWVQVPGFGYKLLSAKTDHTTTQ